MNFFLNSANLPREPKHGRVSFPISTEKRGGGGQRKRGRDKGRKEGGQRTLERPKVSLNSSLERTLLELGVRGRSRRHAVEEEDVVEVSSTWRDPSRGHRQRGSAMASREGEGSVSAISFSGEKTRPIEQGRETGLTVELESRLKSNLLLDVVRLLVRLEGGVKVGLSSSIRRKG